MYLILTSRSCLPDEGTLIQLKNKANRLEIEIKKDRASLKDLKADRSHQYESSDEAVRKHRQLIINETDVFCTTLSSTALEIFQTIFDVKSERGVSHILLLLTIVIR